MFVRKNIVGTDLLEVTDRDSVGYNERMKTLNVGSRVEVDGQLYRITGFSHMELAFGDVRVYFNVLAIEKPRKKERV